ncbi:DUF86 domain-containing protein [Myceligenerans pegani]|uniref:DUF86 domain-containing protein n=1 Tax=Myceligenerans pegani TaxID=2776917 RepID=A0ABR9MX37_9MICO|nr:HepT-like ribonuclease domain-containing protein [Myceligenerans sp. TRM 65318]MBE1875959.1 DUF86 domain-containing protein [Myceligenerans sp. TRM 65318]MBE3018230.1 DUF86 domain-containing protein [Myceligenerans sp. TRM 65318]
MTGTIDPVVSRLLGDLLLHTDAAARLVGRGKPAYDDDEFLRYAAEDLLVRLGEVVARLDRKAPGFIEDHPDLELRNLKDTRNVVAHGYDIVDFEIIWEIFAENLPVVAGRVRDLLDEPLDSRPAVFTAS